MIHGTRQRRVAASSDKRDHSSIDRQVAPLNVGARSFERRRANAMGLFKHSNVLGLFQPV